MNLREVTQAHEENYLSPFACHSRQSQGRQREEAPCDVRTCFQRDKDRIIHAKAFRRLMHKTQAFISPEGDHYRTRLTHTLEVSQISRTIARALALNEDLAEAIALGHDLGHTPFGHAGEDALNALLPEGFRHNEQSVRVVCVLEKNGAGLNLTAEVLDGIRNHRTRCRPATLEGGIVRIADKIAYVNHDIDDALRAGLLQQSDLPKDSLLTLGETASQRIDALIRSVIAESMGKNEISLTPAAYEAMDTLKAFLNHTVYRSAHQMEEHRKITQMLTQIYGYYYDDPSALPAEYARLIADGSAKDRVVCDYVSGMTDRFAIRTFTELFLPSAWRLDERQRE